MLEPYRPDSGNPHDGSSLISWLFASLGDALEDFIDLAENAVYNQGVEWFYGIAVLYLSIYGISVMASWVQVSRGKLIKDGLKLTMIVLLYEHWYSTFLPMAVEMLFDDPAELAGALLDGVSEQLNIASNNSPISIIDYLYRVTSANLFDRMSEFEFVRGSSWGAVIMALGIWAAVFYLSVRAVYLLVSSFIFPTLLLSLGQLFIPMLFFDATQGITKAWINQLITYALIPLITLSVLTLVLFLGAHHYVAIAEQIRNGEPIQSASFFSVFFISYIAGKATSEIPSIAQALGGGIAIAGARVSPGNLAGRAKNALGKLASLRRGSSGSITPT